MIWVLIILLNSGRVLVPLDVETRAECEEFRATVSDLLPPTICSN